MKNYYWSLESWGADYPPENADEIIDAANEKIDAFIAENPDADEDMIAAYSEKLWEEYCAEEAPNTTRAYMDEHPDENLGWCKPYRSDDGHVAFTVNEGRLDSVCINGKYYSTLDMDALWHEIYKALVPEEERNLYSGYTESEIVRLHGYAHECGCADCPWNDICEAMDIEMPR